MREYLPFILIGLAVFSAACVAYVAWEITKDAMREGDAENDAAKKDS